MDCRENKVCFCCGNPYSFWNNEIPITSPSKENALSISVKVHCRLSQFTTLVTFRIGSFWGLLLLRFFGFAEA